MSGKWRTGLMTLGLIGVTLAVYRRSLGYWFAVSDDNLYVMQNPLLTSWHPRHLWAIWQVDVSSNFAPLTLLSYSLDYRVWGMDPFGYRLTNLFWHLVGSLLVYVFLRALRLQRWSAWMGALLFAWHPAQVESVVWIAERKNLLATAGVLASVWAYLRMLETGRPRWRVLMLAAGAGALLCKASAVVTPVLCLLVERCGLHRRPAMAGRPWWLAAFGRTWPLWVMAGFIGLIHLRTQAGPLRLAEWHAGSWAAAAGLLVRVWAFYVQLLVRPGLLSLHHPIDAAAPSGAWRDPVVWQSAGLLGLLGLLLWWWARRQPRVGVWAGWFIIALAPVAGAVFIGVQDRYLYLPMVGVAGLVGEGLEHAWLPPQRTRRWLMHAGGAALAGWLAWASWQRVGVWRTPETLYSDAMRHAPNSDVPRIVLAGLYHETGRQAEAAAFYRSLAEATPAHWSGWLVGGWAHARLGDTNGVLAALAQARRLAPHQPLVHRFEAEMAAGSGRWQEAIEAYGQVVSRQPDAGAYERLASVAAALQHWDAAARWYRRVVAIAPWRVQAHRGLARCLEAIGAPPSSVARALVLAEYWARAWSRLQASHRRMSAVYRARGALADAARSAREASQIAPTSVAVHSASAEDVPRPRVPPRSR